jgi:hypothetical protein
MKKLYFLLGIFALLIFAGIASATTYTCNSCSSCTSLTNWGVSSGDIIQITDDLNFVPSGYCQGGSPDCSELLTEEDCMGGMECNWETIDSCIIISGYGMTIDCQNYALIGEPETKGISLRGTSTGDNVIENCKIEGFDYGIWMEQTSLNNTIRNNSIYNNSIGVYIREFYMDTSNNSVYNNFLNNTINYEEYSPVTLRYTSFNTTENNTINVMGGSKTGGNYWAYPNGSGYSQTCNNANNDSFCDSPFVIDASNTDFLPLTNNYPEEVLTLNISYIAPTPADGANTSYIDFTVNVATDQNLTNCWFDFNSAMNFTATVDGKNCSYTQSISYNTCRTYKMWAYDGTTLNVTGSRTICQASISPVPTIFSPTVTTYNTTSISLLMTPNGTATDASGVPFGTWYQLNGGSNTTFTPNITITATQGNNTLNVFANETGGKIGGATVSFFVDSVAPTITIHSPQNITYNGVSQADLNVSANETVNSWLYSINGGSNTTFTPNTTINIANGSNTLIIYANDTLGNIGQASVSFTVNYPCVTFLNSPSNGNITISSVPIGMTFNCSAINDINLANITLYLNGFPNETRSVTGIYNFSIFTKTIPLGDYNWTCRACDYADQCSFGVPSRTFSIIAPRLIDNMGQFSFIAGIAIGAGILMFLIDAFFGSATEILKDPKKMVTIIIGVIIMIAVVSVLF